VHKPLKIDEKYQQTKGFRAFSSSLPISGLHASTRIITDSNRHDRLAFHHCERKKAIAWAK
jgi:hypothetical protein